MWHLVDFMVCWLLLSPEGRQQVYRELAARKQPRVWRFEYEGLLIIGG